MKSDESHSPDPLEETLRSMEVPKASADFRDRLREQFVQGTLESTGKAPPEPMARTIPWLRLAALVVIGIGIGLLVALTRESESPWKVIDVQGSGTILCDGVPVSIDTLPDALKSGARLKTEGTTELILRFEDQMQWTFTPETDVRLSEDALQATLERGEIRVTTGPSFSGQRLSVVSKEASVEVVGTTFAAIRNDDGTCVCVFEGKVAVGPRGSPPSTIDAGMRHLIYKDERPALTEPLHSMEAMKLQMHRDAALPELENPSPK